jgi:hypothetical protein
VIGDEDSRVAREAQRAKGGVLLNGLGNVPPLVRPLVRVPLLVDDAIERLDKVWLRVAWYLGIFWDLWGQAVQGLGAQSVRKWREVLRENEVDKENARLSQTLDWGKGKLGCKTGARTFEELSSCIMIPTSSGYSGPPSASLKGASATSSSGGTSARWPEAHMNRTRSAAAEKKGGGGTCCVHISRLNGTKMMGRESGVADECAWGEST